MTGSGAYWPRGTNVWVRQGGTSDGATWRRGKVVGLPDGRGALPIALEVVEGRGSASVVAVPASVLEPVNPAMLDGVSDLTQLTYLNEPGILEVLRQRFSDSTIYTNAGCVLVAVNPFKTLPMYGPEVACRYNQRRKTQDDPMEPHVFLTADRAFKQMLETSKSQSVLITGESGAGKTETTKIVMRYLASLAGGTGMEDKVLESNPVLEAFGNAQTLRNKNSSRFGKLIEIYFKRGHICGALIHTYLLEKSRVVHQQPGERNYHIFYQLCRGASDAERQRYHLPGAPEHFHYLNCSGTTRIEGVDDAAGFVKLKKALNAVGITAEQQAAMFSVLSAVLWLGNVEFQQRTEDAVTVDEASLPALRHAASLLACSEAALLAALTTRQMQVGGELITRELNMEAALDNRDALSKAIYSSLFKWMVEQINAALSVGKQRSETTLSLLDIAGFESFKENSFEQLCINYANERLQQQFSKHMFKVEQDIYESESINWEHVEFVDNQDCVDLFETRPPAGIGILSLLDEECMMPKGSDATFASKLQQQHTGNPRFESSAKAAGSQFSVNHYAGKVTYTTTKFLDKNRDTLSKDLGTLLQSSSAPLVQLLVEEVQAGQDRKGMQTVGARFREQLRDLMLRLDSTALHFVRCIKPNNKQEAGHFDAALVLHQLRCCGVLEVARIAQAGYPTRYLHTEFAARYKALLPGLGPGFKVSETESLNVCRRLLEHFHLDKSQYQIGRTRLFFRTGVLGQLEEATARMQEAALVIQSMWRMSRYRRTFLRARAAAVCIQAAVRGQQTRSRYAALLQQVQAAVHIQAAVRGYLQRQEYKRMKHDAVIIQRAWRRHSSSVRADMAAAAAQAAKGKQQSPARESPARQQPPRQQHPDSFEAIQRDFGMGLGDIRRVLGLWQVHGKAFMEWQLETGALAADDSGLLLEIAARNMDSEQTQKRMEGLQIYCHKLERSVDDLREENELLQRAITSLQADPVVSPHCKAVLESMSPSPHKSQRTGQFSRAGTSPPPAFALNANACSPGAQRGLGTDRSELEEHDDDSSISLMSLNEDESYTTGGTPTTASLAAARDESVAVVGMLGREFQKKRSLLDDDAAFIQEVRRGDAEAPGMDPELELQRLDVRFKTWKKEFRERLSHTHRLFRKLKREEQKLSARISSVPGGAGASMQPLATSIALPEARPVAPGEHKSFSRMLFKGRLSRS